MAFRSLLSAMAFCLCSSVFAQPENPDFSLTSSTYFEIDIQSIAIVDIESFGASTAFALSIGAPTEAGSPLGTNPLATNSDNWLNYSCAVPYVTARNIQVSISDGSIPSDFEVRLDVAPVAGAGGGVTGTPVGNEVTLTTTPQEIVSGIRGAFTGTGAGNGHQLTYSLHYLGTNFQALESKNIQISVLYTILDD